MEIVRVVEEGEKAAYSASVLKRMIEGWSDADLTEMGCVDRAALESDLQFTSRIIPLSEVHGLYERRKHFARKRLEDAWGADWGKKLGNWFPPWPSSIFLSQLAIYSEKNPWGEAKIFLETQIAKRLAKPNTCKDRWLIYQDLFAETIIPVEDKKTVSTPADDPSASSTTQEVIRATEGIRDTKPSTAGPSGSSSHPTSSVLPPPSNKLLPASISGEPEVSTLAPKPVALSGTSETTSSRKRKAIEAPPQQEKGNKWRTAIKIPVINLDIEDRIRTMRREAAETQDEQKLRDLKQVKKALSRIGSAGGKETERVGVEVWERRMMLIHEILQIER